MARIEVPALWDQIKTHILEVRIPRITARIQEIEAHLVELTAQTQPAPSADLPEELQSVFAEMRALVQRPEQDLANLHVQHLRATLAADRVRLTAIERYRRMAEQMNRDYVEPYAQLGIELVPAVRTYLQKPAFKEIVLPGGLGALTNIGDVVLRKTVGGLPQIKVDLFASEDANPNYGADILTQDLDALLDTQRFQEIVGTTDAPNTAIPGTTEEDGGEDDYEYDDEGN